MKTVGVYEAKTHFARLLDEVEAGETITITRHGRPVARIVPAEERREGRAEAVEAMLEFGRQHRGLLAGLSIRELIEEGRSH